MGFRAWTVCLGLTWAGVVDMGSPWVKHTLAAGKVMQGRHNIFVLQAGVQRS